MNKNITFEFTIGDDVYHVTPESPKGIILDAMHSVYTNKNTYLVAWSHADEMVCSEHELTNNKTF